MGKESKDCPEFIVQEAIEGFTRNWETRCFWFNGKFLYAIANIAAVSSKESKERIVTGDDIPKEFLENAKRIGAQAIKCLPDLQTGGSPVKNVLVRTDIGCSVSQLHDRYTNWDPKKKTFFLNEIEPSSTTYFVRWLKFDCIPMYAKMYVEKAREIVKAMKQPRKVPTPARARASGFKAKPAAKLAATKVVKAKKVIKGGKLKAKK